MWIGSLIILFSSQLIEDSFLSLFGYFVFSLIVRFSAEHLCSVSKMYSVFFAEVVYKDFLELWEF
jgi:hypothetical protein